MTFPLHLTRLEQSLRKPEALVPTNHPYCDDLGALFLDDFVIALCVSDALLSTEVGDTGGDLRTI